MKNLITILSTILILFTSCKKGNDFGEFKELLTFDCKPTESPYLLEGIFEGQHFCYHEDDKFNVEYSVTSAFSTKGPTMSSDIDTSVVSDFRMWVNWGFRPIYIWSSENELHKIPPPYKHYLFIHSPMTSEQQSRDALVEKVITSEGDLSFRTLKESGFNIQFRGADPDKSRLFVSEKGHQGDGTYLRIAELDIDTLHSDKFTLVRGFDVTFEFTCDLYDYYEPHDYFGRIEEGRLRTYFEVVR